MQYFLQNRHKKAATVTDTIVSITVAIMVRLMGLEPIRSPIRPSNVRVCLFRHNRIFHCERYYNAFRCICQHKLCPKVNIFLKLCKFPPFALLQGAKRAAFML